MLEHIDPQTTTAYWDRAHAENRHGDLTGSTLEEELGNTRATDLVQPGKRVLNIGVGRGHTSRGLIALGAKVSLHDISSVALAPFARQVEGTYTPEQLPKLPSRYFDVALSHLVVQHMNDEALAHQLKHVIRGLKPEGVFALQFATAWEQEGNSIRFDGPSSLQRPYCRTVNRISEMAEDAGGALVYAELTENFVNYQTLWYAAHIIPQEGLRLLRPANARHAWAWGA